MKKLFLIPLLFLCFAVKSQVTATQARAIVANRNATIKANLITDITNQITSSATDGAGRLDYVTNYSDSLIPPTFLKANFNSLGFNPALKWDIENQKWILKLTW